MSTNLIPIGAASIVRAAFGPVRQGHLPLARQQRRPRLWWQVDNKLVVEFFVDQYLNEEVKPARRSGKVENRN
jgi:hypothetical protein